jgi:hypothetical protein
MRLSDGIRVSKWLVLLVAIAAVLSHVCVLPHAHAEEPVATTTHDHEPGGDAADDDAVHGASCDVLRTAPTQRSVLDCTAVRFAPHVEPAVQLVARTPAVVSRGPSPPLFLLHASLLI